MRTYKRDHKRLQRYRAKNEAEAELKVEPEDEHLIAIEARKRSEKAAIKAAMQIKNANTGFEPCGRKKYSSQAKLKTADSDTEATEPTLAKRPRRSNRLNAHPIIQATTDKCKKSLLDRLAKAQKMPDSKTLK